MPFRKNKNPAKNLKDELINFGIDSEASEEVIANLEKYKAMVASGGQPGEQSGDNGRGEFKEKDAHTLVSGEQVRVDVVRHLLDPIDDSFIKKVTRSEVPSPAVMDLVMMRSLDARTKMTREERKLTTPTETLIENFMLFMEARDRKRVKEALRALETAAEQPQNGLGMTTQFGW